MTPRQTDMDFVVYCLDKPGRADTRRRTRPAHLEYAVRNHPMFRYGGPLIDGHGLVCGSLMILRAADRAQLDEHLRGDPFFAADLFASVTVWASRQVFPETVAGALDKELVEARRLAQHADLATQSAA